MAVIGSQGKYRNRRYRGYASQHEADVAANLHALEQCGEILDLKEQVRYRLVPAQTGKIRNERSISYVADFTYLDKGLVLHVCDAKGFKTPAYLLKRKLLLYLLKIEIEEL